MASENNNSKKFDIRTIATVITMAVMGSGVVASWATNKAVVAGLQEDIAKIEQVFTDYKEGNNEKVLSLQLETSSTTSDIATIKQDISEVKADVKSLLKRPR